ncbi:MAG: hypothetical protein U9P38_02930 [Campylobacterota bacterium]|nr:hypothetical protein [Campylobacterota bacterium]
MNYKNILFSLSLFFIFSGCNDADENSSVSVSNKFLTVETKNTANPQVVSSKDYTIDEIYNSMCIECHSTDGSGNSDKLTPSMVKLTQNEIYVALKDVENDKGHIIMEHNRGEILKMGMEYSAKDMAEYMHKRFSK